jgi:erythromycin esterase-like protein
MWRNVVVRDFAEWLQAHNRQRRFLDQRQTGFYGLDLYSLHRSMEEVISYLDSVDPRAADRARRRYACFDHATADDGQAYGYAAAFGAGPSCEREAVGQLIEMHHSTIDLLHHDGPVAEDELFYAQQNAQTVRDAEVYYRAMFSGRVTSWNLRDEHMARTLEALLAHLDRHPGADPARVVVWAHNSHVGDARATEVSSDGQLTLGQLARQRFGGDCRLIGLTTYTGTVTAASQWGGVAERKLVRPALNGSVEELFHEADRPGFVISAMIDRGAEEPLSTVRLGRAIGVIYLPATERQSHYYHVRPADQYDAIIHIDRTRALEPLEVTSEWAAGETPETYPSGL